MSWINRSLGVVTLEMRGHLLVLKASFTGTVSVLCMWRLDLEYPCVGRDVHSPSAGCSSHLPRQ